MADKTEAMDNLIAQDADLIDTNDKDSAVLLPCPFCGKQPWSYDDANHSTAWEVECGNTTCSAQPSVWKTTKVEAIAAWNTRQPTQSDALREENERLREHLISALDTLKDAEVCNDECGPCNDALTALEQSK